MSNYLVSTKINQKIRYKVNLRTRISNLKIRKPNLRKLILRFDTPNLKIRVFARFRDSDSRFEIRETCEDLRFGFEIRIALSGLYRLGFEIRPESVESANLKIRES